MVNALVGVVRCSASLWAVGTAIATMLLASGLVLLNGGHHPLRPTSQEGPHPVGQVSQRTHPSDALPRLLVSAGIPRSNQLWIARPALDGSVVNYSFSPNARWVAICYNVGDLDQWSWYLEIRDARSGGLIQRLEAPDEVTASALAFSPDGNHPAVLGEDRVHECQLNVWNTRDWRIVGAKSWGPALEDLIKKVVYSPDGRRLVIVDGRRIQVLSTNTWRVQWQVPGSRSYCPEIAISLDSRRLALFTAPGDGTPSTLDIWDLRRGSQVLKMDIDETSPYFGRLASAFCFLPGGRELLVNDNRLPLRGPSRGLHPLLPEAPNLRTIAVYSGRRVLVVAYDTSPAGCQYS